MELSSCRFALYIQGKPYRITKWAPNSWTTWQRWLRSPPLSVTAFPSTDWRTKNEREAMVTHTIAFRQCIDPAKEQEVMLSLCTSVIQLHLQWVTAKHTHPH